MGNDFNFWVNIAVPLVAALIGAIIGAIMAFRYQRKMEIQRDKRGLMQMLMAYRTIGAVEVDWIKALNMIDIVFHDNKEVKRLLRSYMYHTDTSRYPTGHHREVLVQLLVAIGKECGYTEITETDIRDGYNAISISHIYGDIISSISKEDISSSPPPSTNDQKAKGTVEGN
jgi:hypothetical protein